MSNVIAFLESLGRNATLPVAGEDFAAAVDALGLDDAPRAALLAGDHATLAELLGARPTMVCALFPADDQPAQDDEPQPDGDTPDEQKESVRHGVH
jgi:hypothetical protein